MKNFLEHFTNLPDIEQLIKMQASKTAPYQRAVNITKDSKNVKLNSFPKVKRIGKRR